MYELIIYYEREKEEEMENWTHSIYSFILVNSYARMWAAPDGAMLIHQTIFGWLLIYSIFQIDAN